MERKIVPALSFDILTPFYDLLSNFVGFGGGFKEKVLEAAQIKDGDRIVDVGCGTGTLAILAKQRYPNSIVVGVDPDAKILEIAKQKAKKTGVRVYFVQAGADSLPIDSRSIDIVVSSLVFHHMPTEIKKKAIKEIYRILKKDGRFLLADFGKAEGFFYSVFVIIVRLLRLPESRTLRDNVEGKIPVFLKETGFKYKEALPRYKGIQFLSAQK